MRKSHLYIVIFFLQIFSASCNKDFLNNSPGNVLPKETYVADTRTAQEYLTGIYALLSKDMFGVNNQVYPDLVADNMKMFPGIPTFNSLYSWQQTADENPTSDRNMNGMSYTGYKIIMACNFLLNKMEVLKNDNTEKANNILGQAYTIRALIHYIMVNTFAQSYNFTTDAQHPGIAYVKTEDWTKANAVRQPVADVYNDIITDLNDAIKLLPETKTSPLVISRYTAMSLLARAYLTKGDYVSAKNLANAVISKYPLMTVNYPDKLYTDQDTEALLQMAPNDASGVKTTFLGVYFKAPILFLVATRDMAVILQENTSDKRNKWVTMSKSGSDTIWNITKFPSGAVPNITTLAGAYYQDIIRSSELYLIASEAYAKMPNPLEDSSRYYLNAIRSRANSTAALVTASGAGLLDSIYKERRKELAFEGFRMYDLLRWKKGVVRNDAISAGLKSLPYPSPYAIAPIPLLDVKLSGATQNEAYQ